MSIVKSAQLPNVGRCEGGLSKATLERLEPYVGKPTSTVLMGLGYGNVPWLPDSCQFSAVYGGFSRKVRHEAAQEDEGRSLGAGLQRQAPNHLKLHW